MLYAPLGTSAANAVTSGGAGAAPGIAEGRVFMDTALRPEANNVGAAGSTIANAADPVRQLQSDSERDGMEVRESVPSAFKGVRVLVVEDAWHVAKALKSMLEQLGMCVVGPTATTLEARRLIATEKPRLALVDVNLKSEMACDLIDELNALGVPVVIASGYAVPPVAVEKAAAFLQKPFSGKELVATLRAVVDRLPLH
jgi:CheY-like chemotaxis protein